METVGHLDSGEKNRYWAIKSYPRLRYYAFNLLSVIGLIFFCFLLPVLYVAAQVTLLYTSRRVKRTPNDPASQDVRTVALAFYERFLEAYPTAVYSPLAKSLELGYFTRHPITGPSLEIAVGDGFFSSMLCSQRSTRIDYGMDLIYETLAASKKYEIYRNLCVSDAEEIPFPDNSFSTIIMNNLMHHLPDRDRILDEIWRVLKPGGVFLFTDNLIGWDAFSFEQRLLRAVGLRAIAKRLSLLKLRLMAQSLIASEEFWKRDAITRRWGVAEVSQFVSRQAMTIASIFEFLNLKFGQPTRKPLRQLLRLGMLRRLIAEPIARIVKDLILLDGRSGTADDAAFLFVALEKRLTGECTAMAPEFACPRCKRVLARDESNGLRCATCDRRYPVVDGVPVLLSYWEKVPGFADYLMFHRRTAPREYIT